MLKKVILVASLFALIHAIDFSYEVPVKKIQCFGDSLALIMMIFILGSNIALSVETQSTGEHIFKVYDPDHQSAFNTTQANQTDSTVSDHPTKNPLKIIKHSLITQKEGNYQFCFQNLEAVPLKVRLIYKTGVDANDYSQLTSKEDFQPMTLQVSKMSDMLEQIQRERRMLIRKARYISKDAEDINFKVVAFSIITLLLMGLLTAFQVVYLKNFFKAKKLI